MNGFRTKCNSMFDDNCAHNDSHYEIGCAERNKRKLFDGRCTTRLIGIIKSLDCDSPGLASLFAVENNGRCARLGQLFVDVHRVCARQLH